MRTLNVVLAVLVSVLIGLAVLEGGLRLMGMGPPRTLNRFDAVAGWSKKPDAVQRKHTSEFDIEIRTNALGLRDDPMSDPAKPANTYRVLALGDSFTLGYTVDREHLFVDVLERWWQAENRRVDVVNAGTEGWSTDQAVAWFLDQGVRFEPDLVLLFAYENDLYWCAETQYVPNVDKPRFTPAGELEPRVLEDHAGRSWTDDWALTRRLFRTRPDTERFTFTPDGGARAILKEWGSLVRPLPEFMGEAQARAAGALKALGAGCERIGARAIVVPIPSHSVVDDDYRAAHGERVLGLPADRWSPEQPVETFLALAAEAGLTAIDPRATLKQAATEEQLYFEKDWHFNPAGNAAFARFVKNELDGRGVFPEGHRPMSSEPVAMPFGGGEALGGVPFGLRLYLALWAVLTLLYMLHYRDEPKWQPPVKVAGLLGLVFGIFIGARRLVGLLPPQIAPLVFALLVGAVLVFVAWKLGRRITTIAELLKSFTLRGHWYLMPLVVVLLTVGSLLVVAASSPLVAPFIYTLF